MEHREDKVGSPAASSGQADSLQLAAKRLRAKIRRQRTNDKTSRNSKYAYRVRSACMGFEGWDIPEGAYVASLCLLRETTLPK
jgi:hypothetical protein